MLHTHTVNMQSVNYLPRIYMARHYSLSIILAYRMMTLPHVAIQVNSGEVTCRCVYELIKLYVMKVHCIAPLPPVTQNLSTVHRQQTKQFPSSFPHIMHVPTHNSFLYDRFYLLFAHIQRI